MSVPALLALDKTVSLCLFPAVGQQHSRLTAGKRMLKLGEGHELLPRSKNKTVAELMAWKICKVPPGAVLTLAYSTKMCLTLMHVQLKLQLIYLFHRIFTGSTRLDGNAIGMYPDHLVGYRNSCNVTS